MFLKQKCANNSVEKIQLEIINFQKEHNGNLINNIFSPGQILQNALGLNANSATLKYFCKFVGMHYIVYCGGLIFWGGRIWVNFCVHFWIHLWVSFWIRFWVCFWFRIWVRFLIRFWFRFWVSFSKPYIFATYDLCISYFTCTLFNLFLFFIVWTIFFFLL